MNSREDSAKDDVYDELGHVARQLHSAVVQLGVDGYLHRIASEIPDARERLVYVGQLTDRAAHKVLGLVEQGQPECRALRDDAQALCARLDAAAGSASPEQAALLAEARRFAEQAAARADQQHETLSEIMLSQDFQDLSGQVIQKVVKIITETEDQLLGLLLKHAPMQASDLTHKSADLQGPQVEGKALEQGDVDDLLASLGF
ncbi:MAG: protein phosphatase CheZ [Burkholderiaceae bacterium]|nr:protein phosphatase CheZ [Burkholderiaceae bacterium]